MEQRSLKLYVEKNANVGLMDIICFEYILLGFKKPDKLNLCPL